MSKQIIVTHPILCPYRRIITKSIAVCANNGVNCMEEDCSFPEDCPLEEAKDVQNKD